MSRVRSLVKGLSARLALIMTLALLPLGLISLYQTSQVIEDAEAVARSSLMSETVAVSHVGRELIREALGAAQGLGAAALDMSADKCSRSMASFVSNHDFFSFAGFITPDGQMNCNSAATPTDVSGSPIIKAAFESDKPYVDFTLRGTYSGEAVTIAAHPVRRGGVMRGLVSISIPHRLISTMLEETSASEEIKVATINLHGEIVASSGTLEESRKFLPRGFDLKDLVDLGGETFESISVNGERRLYAVSAVLPRSVVMVGSWPMESGTTGVGPLQSGLALAFPIVMWIAGIGVAWLGLQRLVVRHVRGLRSAMRRFALGDRSVAGLTLDDPPEELAEAARAFSRMTLIIADAEARQARDLRDKEVLLKEVHHRVKNNLQLIASIMNMQMRNAESPETRQMLRGLQRRVRGLATLHRTLYTSLDMMTVDGGDIVRAVIQDLAQGALPQGVELKIDVIEADLYPDQAVPLSMLSAEALTNAAKYIGKPEDGPAQINVSLSQLEDGRLRLRIANTKGTPVGGIPDEIISSSGLGRRLMQAFVTQIEGESEVTETDNSYIYDVVFARRDFEAEAGKNRAA